MHLLLLIAVPLLVPDLINRHAQSLRTNQSNMMVGLRYHYLLVAQQQHLRGVLLSLLLHLPRQLASLLPMFHLRVQDRLLIQLDNPLFQ